MNTTVPVSERAALARLGERQLTAAGPRLLVQEVPVAAMESLPASPALLPPVAAFGLRVIG